MRERRRYNVAPAIGLGLAGTAAMGTIVGAWLDLTAVYPLEAAAVCAAIMASVVRVAGHQHPYPRFGAANCVTTLRVMLTALVAGLVGNPGTTPLLWCAIGSVVLVSVLDGVDGWLARRTRMASAFGARFDMETDAALILVLSMLVWQHDKAGAWVLLCGLMRYGFVATGRVLPWLAQPLRSTRRGQTVAVAQYIGLSIALAPIVPRPLSAIAAAATLAALVWSFTVDAIWLRSRCQ